MSITGVAALWMLSWACASGDQRDVVRFVDEKRKPLECRVVQMFEGDYIVDVGGKRRTIPRERVRGIETVNDRIRELAKRSKPKMSTKERMALALWASEQALPEMAALCAYRVLLEDPAHQEANEFLGHRFTNGKWYWPLQGKPVPAASFDRALKSSRMLELESEHFVINTDVSLASAVNTLFDLERFYVDWRTAFGRHLGAVEVLGKMRFKVYRSSEDFPAKTSRYKTPFFDPAAEFGLSYTYQESGDEWPIMLFSLATQQLLYTALLPSMGASDAPRLGAKVRHRDAVWLELGLGAWMDSQVEGPPGYGNLTAEPAISQEAASGAYEGVVKRVARWKGLKTLIGWHFNTYYAGMDTVDFKWDVTEAFVHFLMDEDNGVRSLRSQPTTRDALLDYVAWVFRDGKGGSSSLLDDALDRRIETLDRPFRQWLARESR